jgi:hypothetical protein
MTLSLRSAPRLGMAAAACLLLAACGKVTAENYGKVKVGMSYQETTAILGSPTGCDEAAGFRSCRWVDGKSSITVRLAADKVVLHSAENVR